MTLQPEVTTFWGRLGSFGKKTIFRKKWGSWDAFPVLEGTIVVKNLTMGWANQNFGFCVELHRVCNLLLNTPLQRGRDFCASLVLLQNCPGRRWRHKGGWKFALVVQGWHTGCSDLAMDAILAVKFWACSVAQRSPKKLVAPRSLKGGRRKAHASPWSQNRCTVVGHWLPRKKYVLLKTLCINLRDASASLLPPVCLLWPTNSVHWEREITVATLGRPGDLKVAFGDQAIVFVQHWCIIIKSPRSGMTLCFQFVSAAAAAAATAAAAASQSFMTMTVTFG